MPDSIEGCVECNVDSDCDYGNICEVQWNKCVPKPDPCNPSPCGPGSNCMEDHNGNAVCRFLKNSKDYIKDSFASNFALFFNSSSSALQTLFLCLFILT